LKERERGKEGGAVGFGEVEKGHGGMGKTTIFFLPSLTIQNGTDREVDR
jgi:hypothetical protein